LKISRKTVSLLYPCNPYLAHLIISSSLYPISLYMPLSFNQILPILLLPPPRPFSFKSCSPYPHITTRSFNPILLILLLLPFLIIQISLSLPPMSLFFFSSHSPYHPMTFSAHFFNQILLILTSPSPLVKSILLILLPPPRSFCQSKSPYHSKTSVSFNLQLSLSSFPLHTIFFQSKFS
jgi:hypothetical protein